MQASGVFLECLSQTICLCHFLTLKLVMTSLCVQTHVQRYSKSLGIYSPAYLFSNYKEVMPSLIRDDLCTGQGIP